MAGILTSDSEFQQYKFYRCCEWLALQRSLETKYSKNTKLASNLAKTASSFYNKNLINETEKNFLQAEKTSQDGQSGPIHEAEEKEGREAKRERMALRW